MRITGALLCSSECSDVKLKKGESEKQYCRRLTHLQLNEKGIEVIEGLEDCVSLQVLYLYDNRIDCIQNLDMCRALTHLYLQNNTITHISGLGRLVNLQKLYLSTNAISLVEGLEHLQQLEELHIERQRGMYPLAFNANCMRGLVSLQVLNASQSNVQEIAELGSCQRLLRLDLSENHLRDLEELEVVLSRRGAGQVQWLDLRSNPICKIPKYRDRVVIAASYLTMLDDKEITPMERQFLSKLAGRSRRKSLDAKPAPEPTGDQMGVDGTLLMAPNPDARVIVHRRPSFEGGRRTDIQQVQVDPYQPGIAFDAAAEKQRLQTVMQFGGAPPMPMAGPWDANHPMSVNTGNHNYNAIQKPDPAAAFRKQADAGAAGGSGGEGHDEFASLMTEIEERKQFLDDMRKIGQSASYESQIQGEISQRIARLKAIDKERTAAAGNL